MSQRPEIDQSFFKHLMVEDELGVVVRAHIHIEASLNEFIEYMLPFPERLPRLQYESRLRLACALGLQNSHFEALKLLGDMRNGFGHRLNAQLTEEKLNELFSKLPENAQKLTLDSYVLTNQKNGLSQMPKFSSLSPKERFILIAVVLKSFVVVAAHEAGVSQENVGAS